MSIGAIRGKTLLKLGRDYLLLLVEPKSGEFDFLLQTFKDIQ